jgi:PhnB protein
MISLSPYLNFRDNAREAMEFYHSVFGGNLDVTTFKDFHASEDPSEDDLVMHSVVESKHIKLMASDTPNRMREGYTVGTNFSLSISGTQEDEETLRGYFDKLSEGGKVVMKYEKAMWGDMFGMVDDKYGIGWMVNVEMPKGEKN